MNHEVKDRDAIILKVLKRLEEARPHANASAWERGWNEALELFRANPCEASLVPAFIKTDQPMRYHGEFYESTDEWNELTYVRQVQAWLGDTFEGCSAVYEFGCGTGFNLVALARMLPGRDFFGFDQSPSAVRLVKEAASALDLPIAAEYFDMGLPGGVKVSSKAGVLTFGSVEQLGDARPFIDYLIEQGPKLVVHVEPVPELLDEDDLVDWLSLTFHKRRGYTRGLLPYLQGHPKVEVLNVERSHFGSLMLESYARIVWRPR